MDINLKKGKVTDLTVVLGNYFQQTNEAHSKIFELITQNNLGYTYSDKQDDFYAIQLYLSDQKKDDKTKAAEPAGKQNKDTKENNSNDINSILAKYSYQPQSKNAQPKPKMKIPDNSKLRLYLLYVTSINLDELPDIFENLKKTDNTDAKYIFLMQGIQDFVSSREMKNKGRQRKDNFLSSQMMSQGMSQFQPESAQANGAFESREKLDEFLVTLSIESHIDYKLTNSQEESLEYIKNCISSTIESKYKKNLGHFDVKGHNHTAVSLYAGFEDFYSLAWIELLMAIPGISEDKAIAIAKSYPTMKSLMDALDGNENKALLEDIKVVHNYDESKAKRLGKAASAKVIKAFTSKNPDEII